MIGRKIVLLGVAIAAAGLLFAIVAAVSVPSAAQPGMNVTDTSSSSSSVNNEQSTSFLYKLYRKYHDYENGVLTVRAGGGSAVAPLTWFFPRDAEINVGETVTWISPTTVGEPHTVTFIMGENMHAPFAAPFVMPNANTTLSSADPNANAEALVMPGPNGMNIVVAVNSRSINPTVIDSDGNVTTLPPNASYTMDGTEKFINSGWMWPADQIPPGFPPISTFSVKFNEVGMYGYVCEVHPWMTGQVVVK